MPQNMLQHEILRARRLLENHVPHVDYERFNKMSTIQEFLAYLRDRQFKMDDALHMWYLVQEGKDIECVVERKPLEWFNSLCLRCPKLETYLMEWRDQEAKVQQKVEASMKRFNSQELTVKKSKPKDK